MMPKNLPKIDLKTLKSSKLKVAVLAVLTLFVLCCLITAGLIGYKHFVQKGTKGKPFDDPTKPTKISYQGKEISVPPRVLEVTPEELNRQIQRKENIKIIQIANPSEWYQGHIKGSTYIPKEALSNAPPPSISQEDNLVLVSKDGKDSASVADKLVFSFGFNRSSVRSLAGGLNAWQKAGYKLEK